MNSNNYKFIQIHAVDGNNNVLINIDYVLEIGAGDDTELNWASVYYRDVNGTISMGYITKQQLDIIEQFTI